MATSFAKRLVNFQSIGPIKLRSNPAALEENPRNRSEAIALVMQSIPEVEHPERANGLTDSELVEALNVVRDLCHQYQDIWGDFSEHSDLSGVA